MGQEYHDARNDERSSARPIAADQRSLNPSPYRSTPPHHQQPQQNGMHHDTQRSARSPGAAPGGGGRDQHSTQQHQNHERSRSGERERSRGRSARGPNGGQRICKKCQEPLTGQFVRALDGMFHLECFRCRDCGQIVASKFFPADDETGLGQYPLCETDYFRRLGLLCHQCNGALRGSYITALDRKYHVDHFTCSLCSTVFGASDSYYEHDNKVYCHYHYSTQFAQKCNGCHTAILKQFVEIYRNGQNQHWHPECYMIHKFWNVRLGPPGDAPSEPEPPDDPKTRDLVRQAEEKMEAKVYRIWSVLSTFEESSAACISDMLLHVSNGAYVDGVAVAKKFIAHVEILFKSADRLDGLMLKLDMKALSYGREAKLLCKKIVQFFTLLSKTQDKNVNKIGVTQELLQLVTGLAHYLKLLIRICLQGALRVEKDKNSSDGLYLFLDDLGDLEPLKNETGSLHITAAMSRLADNESDQCIICHKAVEDECAANGEKRWHIGCVSCARCGKELGNNLQDAHINLFDQKVFCGSCSAYSSESAPPFERVSRLKQYVFLLHVALARMLSVLRDSGALVVKEDPNDHTRDLVNGSTQKTSFNGGPTLLGDKDHQRESSYENTLNDVRRLRSTRLDKHLSTSRRKTRSSRLMDEPTPTGTADGNNQQSYRIEEGQNGDEEEGSELVFGNQDAITLDDIPRIVAAEQAKEQRMPHKPGRQELFRSPATEPFGLGLNQARSRSNGPGADSEMGQIRIQRTGGQKYISELSPMEYFIVRHLAVLTMLPMVESEFSLQELLSFIESKKPAGFWGKWFKNDTKKGGKKKGIFGVPLEQMIERDGADSTDGVGPGTLKIPAIIDDIVSAMRKMDLSVEGVFRKNGNIKKLGELCDQIDREGCDNINLNNQPVVQVAALLKRYLRELPDPLMTQKLYRLWIVAAKIPDEQKRRQCLHLACCLLPKCHRDSLEILFCFLKWASSFHQVDDDSGSKMDIRNLATVIAPNILITTTKGPALDSEPMYAILAVETLLAEIEEMCLVPDDLVDVLNDPTLFSNNGDITTKELLRRFGGRVSGGQATLGNANDTLGGRADPNLSRPHARRIETAPTAFQDAAAWSQHDKERSTSRPAAAAGGHNGNNTNNNNNNIIVPQGPSFSQSNPSTPPSKWSRNQPGGGDDSQHASPYRPSFDASSGADATNGDRNGINGAAVSSNSSSNGNGAVQDNRREWRNSGYAGRTPQQNNTQQTPAGHSVGVGGSG